MVSYIYTNEIRRRGMNTYTVHCSCTKKINKLLFIINYYIVGVVVVVHYVFCLGCLSLFRLFEYCFEMFFVFLYWFEEFLFVCLSKES